jgi:hydroxyacylglutathione hydrolase
MTQLEITQFMCRSDNFGVIIHDRASGLTAAIDTPEEAAVRAALKRLDLKLTHILTTHSHFDHVEGHLGLKAETGCVIYGPEGEKANVPGIDHAVKEGDEIPFGAFKVKVLDTPGHTPGHITLYIDGATEGGAGVAFTGDTLFSVGCGRVIEGLHGVMYTSLQKIAKLPAATQIYCGHEYTQSNVKFALSVEPHNEALLKRRDEVDALRSKGLATLPVTLGKELETNPFLRTQSPEIRKSLGLGADTPDAAVFEALRRGKDKF